MKKLERRLGLAAIISISISSMLGSGIFVLPGLAFSLTGPSVWLCFLISALCVLPAAISKSELATAMPTSGGTYVYLERTFGPLAGTVSGLGLWLSLLLKSAFALIGLSAYLTILADVPIIPVSLTFLAFITILNIFGVGKVSGLLTIVVTTSIIGLALLSGYGALNIEPSYLQPFMSKGPDGFINATALVFVSFAGVTKVAAIAEEIKSPQKNLPKGILLSLLTVTIVYSSVTFIMAGTVPLDQLAGNYKPVYTMAKTIAGNTAGVIAAVIAILTMMSMANAGLLASSRFPFAMSRDHLLPATLGKLNRRFLTPTWSIFLSALIMGTAILLLDVGKLAKLASSFMLMIYVVENIAVIVLRETRVQWYKPEYKSPLYPFTQILGIISGLFLLYAMGMIVPAAILGISIPGCLLFFFYSRKRTTRKGVVGIRGKRSDLVESESDIVQRIEEMDVSKDARVVIPLFGKERSPETLVELGAALADNENLEVAHLTEVPEQTELSSISDDSSSEMRSVKRRVEAMSEDLSFPLTFDPVASHDIAKTIFDISQRLHCQWLITEWHGYSRGAFTVHNPVGWLKSHLLCNFGIFRDVGVRYIRHVLVILRSDGNDHLVLDTADHLAQRNKAKIVIAKFIDKNASPDDLEKEKDYLEKLSCQTQIESCSRILNGDNEVEAIINASVEYDLIVFGGRKHKMTKELFGTPDDKIMSRVACSAFCVQRSTTVNQR